MKAAKASVSAHTNPSAATSGLQLKQQTNKYCSYYGENKRYH